MLYFTWILTGLQLTPQRQDYEDARHIVKDMNAVVVEFVNKRRKRCH